MDGLQKARARGPASNHEDQDQHWTAAAGEKEALAFLSLNMFWTTTTLRSVSLLLLLRERLTLLAMQCGLVCLPFFAWSRNSIEWNAKWFTSKKRNPVADSSGNLGLGNYTVVAVQLYHHRKGRDSIESANYGHKSQRVEGKVNFILIILKMFTYFRHPLPGGVYV